MTLQDTSRVSVGQTSSLDAELWLVSSFSDRRICVLNRSVFWIVDDVVFRICRNISGNVRVADYLRLDTYWNPHRVGGLVLDLLGSISPIQETVGGGGTTCLLCLQKYVRCWRRLILPPPSAAIVNWHREFVLYFYLIVFHSLWLIRLSLLNELVSLRVDLLLCIH